MSIAIKTKYLVAIFFDCFRLYVDPTNGSQYQQSMMSSFASPKPSLGQANSSMSFYSPTPSSVLRAEEEENLETSIEEETNPAHQPKYLVFKDQLLQLFKICQSPGCGKPMNEIDMHLQGSMVTIEWECLNGHQGKWCSQPVIRGMPLGNLLGTGAAFFTGLGYTDLKDFTNCLGIPFIQKTEYYEIQRTYSLPVVDKLYNKKQTGVVERFKGKKVKLQSDARHDTMGFSAKYCTYTGMEEETGLILHFELVQCTEASSSPAMEKVGFERLVQAILDFEVIIGTMITDRSISIKALMKTKKYLHIDHQVDIWHITRGITLKLWKAARKAKCKELMDWIQHVTNQIWWCCANCKGDPKVL